jgi:hypothetical protein
MPDMDVIDPMTRAAAVNALILLVGETKGHLGSSHPDENLAAMYHTAEVSWTRGDFHRFRAATGLSESGRSRDKLL